MEAQTDAGVPQLAPPDYAGALTRAEARSEKESTEREARIATDTKQQQEGEEQEKKGAEQLDAAQKNQPPKFEPAPAPDVPPTDPKQIWASSAMLLAAIGSAFARRPAVAAMNAAAKVLQGYRQGDLEAAKQAFDTWKVSNDNATKAYDYEMDLYKEAIDIAKTNLNEGAGRARAYASSVQNERMLEAASAKNLDGMKLILDEMKVQYDRLKENTPKIQEENELATIQIGLLHDLKDSPQFQQARPEQQRLMVSELVRQMKGTIANNPAALKWQVLTDPQTNTQFRYNPETAEATTLDGKPYEPGGAARLAGAGGGKIDMNDPGDKSYVESIANYKVRLPSPGRNPEQRKALVEAALKVNPDFQEAKYDQAAKALRDFGTGKQGDIARSLNVSVSHLETLRELGRALDNGDVTLVNAAKQRFAEEFGVPAPTNFDTAKSIVADEVAKGVIGGQSAQSDRETLADSLRKERSLKAIEGAIDTFQTLLGGQLGGLRSQYERTTGAKHFDETFLSEPTRKALTGKEGKAAGGAKAKYRVDQIIPGKDGKQYRVTGGDLNGDPDVELVQ
jgi:hypothetical protein